MLRSHPASATCTQQAGRGGTVTFWGPKTRDGRPSALMLSGKIASLVQITLQSHAGELRHLDFGCLPFSIPGDLCSSPAICEQLITRPRLCLFSHSANSLGCHLKPSFPCKTLPSGIIHLSDWPNLALQGLASASLLEAAATLLSWTWLFKSINCILGTCCSNLCFPSSTWLV